MSGRRVRKGVVLAPVGPDLMADRRLLTVVVTVVVGPDGRLLHGTVIDVEEGVHGRFHDWAGLGDAAAAWLAARLALEDREQPPRLRPKGSRRRVRPASGGDG